MPKTANTNKSMFINSALLITAAGSFNATANEQVKTLEKTKIDANKQDTYKVDKVSNHKITTDLVDTAKTISVLDSQLLADQGVTNLNDALRNVAGVSTFGAGEGGGGNITTNDKITIRGFNSNGNIYIDGVRDIAGYSRDLFNVNAVEVVKGASSSLSGKGTSGGAVNLSTKQAQFDKFSNLDASYDDAERLRLTLDSNHVLSDTAAFRINALYSDGGDPLNNGVEEYQTTAIAPAIQIAINDQFNITADALLMQQDNNPMLGLPYINEDAAAQLGRPEGALDESLWDNYYGVAARDFEEVDVAIATIRAEYNISPNIKLFNQLRFGENDKKSVVSRPLMRSERDPETRERTYYDQVDVSWTRNLDEEHSLFVNQLDLITQFKTGNIQHDLVIGTEIYKEEKESQRLSNNIVLDSDYVDINNPQTNTPYTGNIDVDGLPTKTEGEGMALYALSNMTINDNVLLSAGLRWEDYEATGARYMWQRIDGQWHQEYADGLKSSADFVSWNLSAGYKANENIFVYLAAANSQDPAAGDLAFTWSQTAVDQIGALDPQESKNYELGIKASLLDDSLEISAAYFDTTKTVTDRDDDGNYFLAGEQVATGFEFTATGKITADLDVVATFTNQDTEVTKDYNPDTQGNGLSGAPDNMASVWLNYEPSQWQFGVGAQYSSGDTYWRRNTAYFETGSYTLLHAMVGYEFSKEFVLRLNVDNVANKSYITDYSARGHFKPADPRLIKLSAQYRF